jgi:PKD repeat protein
LDTLTEVACRAFAGPMTFRAVAGQTYYLQLGDGYGSGPSPVRLSLDVAPAVEAHLGYYPFDASTFDQVGFYDRSFDPGEAPIVTEQWQFGDGTSGVGYYVPHRYAADGDYPVSLTVTTSDGRTASTSEVIPIRTHDVSIDRFTVPNTAHAGQTKRITVNIRNARYDEAVRVQLFRSGSYGFEFVGELNQLVVARPNRTTEFPFNYTFTTEDATAGKVTFKAIAMLADHRDALPPDNEVISTPTTVN